MKLVEQLIEKGLNPRLLYCGFILPGQVKEKLEEFLPYCIITEGVMDEDLLHIKISFHDFVIGVKFIFHTNEKSGVHYIDKIEGDYEQ